MTGSDFYAYILKIFKRTDKSTEAYEAISDAVMDMKLAFFFEDFKEEGYNTLTTLGDYKLPVPTDFGHLIGDIILLDGSSSEPLIKLSKDTFDEQYPNPNYTSVTKGRPENYCLYGGQILIGPVPDSITQYTYSINYSTEEAETITSDTTSVPFTDKYRWILRYIVLGKLYAGMNNKQQAEYWSSKGRDGLEMIVANEEYNTVAAENVAYTD